MKDIKEFLNKYTPHIIEYCFGLFTVLLPVIAHYGNSISVSTILVAFMAVVMVLLLPLYFKACVTLTLLPLLIIFVLSLRGFVFSEIFLISTLIICTAFYLSYPKKITFLSSIIKYCSALFSLVVIFQVFIHTVTGYHIPFIITRFCLPNLEGSYYKLIETGMANGLYRPSGLFLEPAQFAQYSIVGLVLCLFSRKKKDLVYALVISLGIVLSKSGIGIVMVAVSWVIFFTYLIVISKLKVKIIIGIIFAVAVFGSLLAFFFIPQFHSAVDRVISGEALKGRLFWFGTYFKNVSIPELIFGKGFGSLPNNIYFTGFMEMIWTIGIIGILCVLSLLYFGSNRISIRGLALAFMFFTIQLVANNISIPFMFFIFGVVLVQKEEKHFINVANYHSEYEDKVRAFYPNNICRPSSCTGCGLCFNICSTNAIAFDIDVNGFYRPSINPSKCVSCNKCRITCPINNPLPLNQVKTVYAATSKKGYKSKNSTSGGIATLIARATIESGGIFYGSLFDSGTRRIGYKRVDNISDIALLSGSKYVQSDINDTYKRVRDDLENGRRVTFIGNPCYVAGLKRFLSKEYDRLLLIDLVCHGVPSQKMLWDDISQFKKRINKTNIANIIFRKKREYVIELLDKDNKVLYSGDYYKDYFVEAFCLNLSLRDSCYECKYATKNRVGDITLGDFWGISKSSKLFEIRNDGLNLCMLNTLKGILFFETLKDKIDYDERTLEEAVQGNSQLRRPAFISDGSINFKYNYSKIGFCESVKGCRNFKQKLSKNILVRLCIKHRKRIRTSKNHKRIPV